MTQIIRKILFIAISVVSLVASAQENKKFYYVNDEKIYLEESKDKYVIAYNGVSSASERKSLISDNYARFTEWKSDSICFIEINPTLRSNLDFVNDLKKQSNVKSCFPIYITDSGSEIGITNEIIVKFKKDVSTGRVNNLSSLQSKYNLNVKKESDLYSVITVPEGVNPIDVANELHNNENVEYSHPNFLITIYPLESIPNDPFFKYQFSLRNTGQVLHNGKKGTSGADIRAADAWEITKGTNNITIAVLDQGLTSNHPDLPNTRQVRVANSNIAGGNVNDPSPTGDDYHGNACAGIIAATHNSEGIAGIAPNCKIMPFRIIQGSSSTFDADAIAQCFTRAKNNGADIISNSWGLTTGAPARSNLFPVLTTAISDVIQNGRGGKGCVVVFAAGNTAQKHTQNYTGYVTYPANINVNGVIRVGASDRDDNPADYSPYSDPNSPYFQIVDVMAPSHRAYSSQIPGETSEAWTIDIPGNAGCNPVKSTDGGSLPTIGSYMPSSGTNHLAYTAHFGGTSYSAPQVAAVAALMLSINPNLTAIEVSNIIQSTARKAGTYPYSTVWNRPNGLWNMMMGHGVVHAYDAIKKGAAPIDINFSNKTTTSNTTLVGRNATVSNVVINNERLSIDNFGSTLFNSTFEIKNNAVFEIKNN